MKKIWKQRYQIMDAVGKGGNGQVYKVWDLHLEKEWAMKILNRREKQEEWRVLTKISHPNFPRIVDAFEEEENSVIIMDYIKGVTLEEMISKGPLEEEQILEIAGQICEAVLYLHQSVPALLYLDLKPSNIILEENKNLKLVDLGSVAVKGKARQISGTYGFASPEQIKVQRAGICLNEQSDVFSFGMVLYAMAMGTSQKLPVIDANSRHGIFLECSQKRTSFFLQKMIEKCTRGKTDKRYYGMREVKKELENWNQGRKKKWSFTGNFLYRRQRQNYWIQEKSILCTQGRHSFYIAKRFFFFAVCTLAVFPIRVSGAKQDAYLSHHYREEKEEKEFQVFLRDWKLRKVLVREGCAYKTKQGILVEIPWEGIEGNRCEIVILCKDESKKEKQFLMECIYAK